MSTIKVNNIVPPNVGEGVTIDGLQMPTAGAFSNRNLIINGAMQVAQRGTSQTATGFGSIDRWYSALSGATITMSQESFTLGQTDVPGASKYLKSSVTTGNNNSGVLQKIEAQNAFLAINNTVTLSYYAKGTSPTSGLQVGIMWFDGSSASAKPSESVTLTASWVKYTHTFTVPSISGLTMTNASAYLEVHWLQKNADTGTAAYEVNLAQVQLEVGTKATPFEYRSYGDELLRCSRYFVSANWQFCTKISGIGYRHKVPGPGVAQRIAATPSYFNPGDGTANQAREHSSGTAYTINDTSDMNSNAASATAYFGTSTSPTYDVQVRTEYDAEL